MSNFEDEKFSYLQGKNHFMIKFIRHISLPLFVSLIAASCATMVPPQGGPRDKKPPVVEECDPPNGSLNFEPGKVKISFNEFVQLSDVQSQILISPPVKRKPMFQIRGKSVIFEVPDSLKDKTTYSIFFGNSISDITENNQMSNYKYAFSTGDYLDSLVYQGTTRKALTHETEAGWIIMLYKKDHDSIPLKERPYYVAKTNKQGHFRFENLAKTQYKIFGLKDNNNNYLFDQPNELIAFSESLIEPHPPVKLPDSLVNDSINTDSLRKSKLPKGKEMVFFRETDTLQDVKEAKALNPYVYEVALKFPSRKLSIDLLSKTEMQTVMATDKDSIKIYFNQAMKDSVQIALHDSIYNWRDTVWVEPADEKLNKNPISSNAEQSMLPYFQDIYISSEVPYDSLIPEKIALTSKVDSIIDTISTQFIYTDSISRTRLHFSHEWNSDKQYNLTALPGAFQLKNGFINDTLSWDFGIKLAENFGQIIFGLENVDSTCNYIVQLTNTNKEVIRQDLNASNKKLSKFPHLIPQKYKIRVIEDRNHNRQWDTGNYLKGLKPERSWFFEKEFNVRANWDIRETMSLY